MNREEFFEWLNSCPSRKWEIVTDDYGCVLIVFPVDEKED